MNLLDQIRGKLIVSCQPVDDGPMDHPNIVAAMALAAEAGGAAGLRIEGLDNLAMVRPATKLPIIGIVKHFDGDKVAHITPGLEDVAGLVEGGAQVIAYDATTRPRAVPTGEIVAAIKSDGVLAMADCANLADGERALAEGADILGTTLSGYFYDIAPADANPDFDLIAQFKNLGGFVMAEGRINSPALAARARQAGADCVTVGSAITRIEHTSAWFATAVSGAFNS